MKYLKYLILIGAFFCSALHAKNLLIKPDASPLDAKSYEIQFSGKHFITSGYFDVNGEEVELVEGSAFSMSDLNLDLSYAFSKKTTFLLGSRFRMVSSTSSSTSLSSNGIESVWGGIRFNFSSKKKWVFAARALYRITAHSNEIFENIEQIPDEIVLGDDGTEYRLGLIASYKRSRSHFLNFHLDYVSPPNDLSSESQYNVNSIWTTGKWLFGLGVEGIYSFGTDSFGSEPEKKPFLATGQTTLFNSINRNIIMPYLKLGHAFRTWRLDLTGAQVIQGASTDKGMKFGLSILWNSQGVSSSQVKAGSFKEYLIEADIIKISPRKSFVKIDHGVSSDVEKGMPFDIYQTDFFGGNKLVAAGVVYQIGSDWSILKIVKKYRPIEIKKGFSARGY